VSRAPDAIPASSHQLPTEEGFRRPGGPARFGRACRAHRAGDRSRVDQGRAKAGRCRIPVADRAGRSDAAKAARRRRMAGDQFSTPASQPLKLVGSRLWARRHWIARGSPGRTGAQHFADGRQRIVAAFRGKAAAGGRRPSCLRGHPAIDGGRLPAIRAEPKTRPGAGPRGGERRPTGSNSPPGASRRALRSRVHDARP